MTIIYPDDTIIYSQELPESRITVLATGQRERLDWSGSQITVFDRRDIKRVQGADLTRLLERAPGVTATRNGPPGSFTAIRVRGAEAEQLLVLLDGVRMADPAAPSGGFDFGSLAMGNLVKVELQRSSNSTIWGADAIGGVLALTSHSGGGFDGSAEYGAHDSLYLTAGAAVSAGPAKLSLRGGHARGDGFSAADGGTEADGYRQSEMLLTTLIDLSPGFSMFARGRYADGRAQTDGFPAPDYMLADTLDYQDTRQISGAAGLAFSSRGFDLRAAYSQADTERENYDAALGGAPTFTADGTSQRVEVRGLVALVDGLNLNFGGESEWLSYSTLFDARQETAIIGGYGQIEYDDGPLHLALGLRRADHRDFGGAWTLGGDASLNVTDDMRVTASYGEGFKPPSLFQLHSDYGNSALQPERSRSFDGGVSGRIGPFSLNLIGFRRDTSDLIQFTSCVGESGGICADRPYGTYDNIGRARAEGLEVEIGLSFKSASHVGLAYAYIDTQDRTTGSPNNGNRLARRPAHALTLTGEAELYDDLTVGADLRVVSSSFDDAANTVRLGGYETLTLRVNLQASDAVSLFARLENAWDEQYQTAAGYATQGRGAHIGARAEF